MSMHSPIVRHTLTIFDRLQNQMPPLFPYVAAKELEDTIRVFRDTPDLSLSDLEDSMIFWGKRLWPYRSAFAELSSAYEDRLGRRFICSQLSGTLADRYREFEEHGGRFRDIIVEPPKPFFSQDDHSTLHTVIMLAWKELRQHAVQGALSVDKDRYTQLIRKYGDTLREVDRTMDALEVFSAREIGEYPALAEEIKSFICGVNYGFCALGPAFSLQAIRGAHEHFFGRKKEKKMTRI